MSIAFIDIATDDARTHGAGLFIMLAAMIISQLVLCYFNSRLRERLRGGKRERIE